MGTVHSVALKQIRWLCALANNACNKSSAVTCAPRKRLCRILSCTSESLLYWLPAIHVGKLFWGLRAPSCQVELVELPETPSKDDFAFLLVIEVQVLVL